MAELCAHHGVGRAKAVQIKAALELGRRLQLEPVDSRPEIRSPADAAQFLAPRMATPCHARPSRWCCSTADIA